MALKPKWGVGPVITMTHTAAVVAYVPVKIGDMLVIPQDSAAVGVPFSATIPGVTQVFDGAVAGAAITKGATVYRIGSGNKAGEYNTAESNNTRAGYALAAAVDNDEFRIAMTGAL